MTKHHETNEASQAGAWVDWSALQERIPEDEKSSFQQTFTQLAAPASDVQDDIPYMNEMTEGIQATLEKLEQEGKVKREDGKLLIARELIPEAFRKYL